MSLKIYFLKIYNTSIKMSSNDEINFLINFNSFILGHKKIFVFTFYSIRVKCGELFCKTNIRP